MSLFPTLLLHRRSLTALALALTLGLSACGGSDSTSEAGPSASPGSTTSTNSGEASSSSDDTSAEGSSGASGGDDSDAGRVKLAQCLRDNGVDVPDNAGQPGAGLPGDIDQDKLQEAIDGPCKEYQQDAFGDISSDDRQELQDSFQAFAQCMRDNGVDVPDITPGAGGAPPAGAGQIDQDDPKVQAASKECQDKLPQGLPGGGGQ